MTTIDIQFTCFEVNIIDRVAHIQMSRPAEMNSMNKAFWKELPILVNKIDDDFIMKALLGQFGIVQ